MNLSVSHSAPLLLMSSVVLSLRYEMICVFDSPVQEAMNKEDPHVLSA
jgi:hypothetical protein